MACKVFALSFLFEFLEQNIEALETQVCIVSILLLSQVKAQTFVSLFPFLVAKNTLALINAVDSSLKADDKAVVPDSCIS